MSIPQDAKEHILRLIPLGVDIFTACVQAHLTFDQMDELEEDKDFQRELDYEIGKEEVRLLQLYAKTVNNAASIKLDHSGVQKRLKMLYPEKYGNIAMDKKAEQGNKGAGGSTNGQVSTYITMPDNGRGKI